MQEFEELNTKYFNEITKTVNGLVDCKVAIHAHDTVIEGQIDDFKSRLTAIEGNILGLTQDNQRLSKEISEC